MKEEIRKLAQQTGCSISLCKDAYEYAQSYAAGRDMAVAYLKAKTLAVKTTCSFHERVLRFLEDESCKS